MNYKLVGRIISLVLLIEAFFMLVPLFIALGDKEGDVALSFLYTIAAIVAVSGAVLFLTRKRTQDFYAQEGFLATGLSWIFMSLFGCLPFFISGYIPNMIDAFFETVSGFTTTGSSILTDVEALPRALLYWRSFTHWLGGMGVLVFLMAVIPAANKGKSSDMHLLRAESPGPDVGKLTPHMKSTATILYLIYIGMTVLCVVFLLIGKMPFFDSICIAFGTAGTGGFGVRNDSLASYTPFAQNVTTIFMFLFGVNFNIYYLMLLRKFRSVIKSQELRVYILYYVFAVAGIFCTVINMYDTWNEALRHSAFQASSIMTTTGYATTDFELWPSLAKGILLALMCIGACAGSTGGGIKVSRTIILAKTLRRNVRHAIHPDRTVVIQMDNRRLNEHTITNVSSYLVAYVAIIAMSFLLISIDNQTMMTNFSAVIACFNNIGPGFETVGATGNYSTFSGFSKIVLCADMLLGRLEIFPLLAMLSRTTWNRNL